jgi:putative hydrolase of the HAD superfamily
MAEVPTLFFDVGGVILTNAWDTAARRRAAEAFGLDYQEFQTRHEMLKTAFETGRLSLDRYIKKTVFHRSRAFSPDDFKAFMFSQSRPLPESLAWVRALAAQRKYRLFTLNNESRELHEYRVRAFQLDQIFDGFLTSCYLGQVKPDESLYLNALGIAGCGRDRAIFIDDRPVNVEPAQVLGLIAVRFEELDQLREVLKEHGIEA